MESIGVIMRDRFKEHEISIHIFTFFSIRSFPFSYDFRRISPNSPFQKRDWMTWRWQRESWDRYLKKDGPRVLVEGNRREMVIDTHREAKRGRLAVDLLGLVQTIPRRWLCLVVTSFRRSASFVDSLRIYTYTDAYVISYICHDKSIPNSRMRSHRK